MVIVEDVIENYIIEVCIIGKTQYVMNCNLKFVVVVHYKVRGHLQLFFVMCRANRLKAALVHCLKYVYTKERSHLGIEDGCWKEIIHLGW